MSLLLLLRARRFSAVITPVKGYSSISDGLFGSAGSRNARGRGTRAADARAHGTAITIAARNSASSGDA